MKRVFNFFLFIMMNYFGNFGGFGGMPFALPFLLPMIFLIPWVLIWKGLALWHAARRGEPWWFLALLVINTVGILEIIYLFLVAKIKWEELLPKGKK